MEEGSSDCTSLLVLPPQIYRFIVTGESHMLTASYSLRPKSYVLPRSHRLRRPNEYSQPLQKTAQLWNKSKEDLAGQLADLKTYVTGTLSPGWTGMLTD